jgi:hypothetical protein
MCLSFASPLGSNRASGLRRVSAGHVRSRGGLVAPDACDPATHKIPMQG